jgi:hypothetical protein
VARVIAMKPALGLFLLAPLVGEFLLGNLSITALPLLLVLAPLYGGGALLVRETARRAGGGWPAILLLALAYAVAEEGLVSHSLFNPEYAGHELHRYAPLEALGMGGWWTVFVLTLHTVGSIATPIAVVELLAGDRGTTPWLGRAGLGVAGALFVLGGAAAAAFTIAEEDFVPSAAQLTGAVVVVVALVVAALRLPRRTSAPDAPAEPAPSPRRVAAAAVGAGLLFMVGVFAAELDWVVVAGWLALWAWCVRLVRRWSRRPGWSAEHRLALTVGPLATYGWYAFVSVPMDGGSAAVDAAGNAVFLALAITLVAVTRRRIRRTPRVVDVRAAHDPERSPA